MEVLRERGGAGIGIDDNDGKADTWRDGPRKEGQGTNTSEGMTSLPGQSGTELRTQASSSSSPQVCWRQERIKG